MADGKRVGGKNCRDGGGRSSATALMGDEMLEGVMPLWIHVLVAVGVWVIAAIYSAEFLHDRRVWKGWVAAVLWLAVIVLASDAGARIG